MAAEDKKFLDRMQRTLNGPQRPSMPGASPFMVEDAESEIRRSVQRHYEMQAKIEELTTDRDTWRNDAQVFKTENERLQQRVKDTEEHNDELKHALATLEAHMQTSAQSFVTAFNALRGIKHIKTVVPPALEALEHKIDRGEQENE